MRTRKPVLALGVSALVLSLASRTAADRFAQSQTRFTALELDIMQGRKPVSAWGVEADAWWKRYGQQMSEELAQAYVDAGRG